jgi:hypothetical protein
MYSAGVLLYFKQHGQMNFILGKDSTYNCWSDFGGKAEPVDQNNPIRTAARECYEETAGVVFGCQQLESRLIEYSQQLVCTSYKKNRYYMYLLEIDQDVEIQERFNHMQMLIKEQIGLDCFKEKSSIGVFTLDQIQANRRLFRSVFYNSIADNVDLIQGAY